MSYESRVPSEEMNPENELDAIYELMDRIKVSWSVKSGRDKAVDKSRVEEIHEQFPTKPGRVDPYLEGRVKATAALVLETAGLIPKANEISELLEAIGIEWSEMVGQENRQNLLLALAANEGLTEDILTRMLVVEGKIPRAYKAVEAMGTYEEKEALRHRTSRYTEENTGVLAIIARLGRNQLIGSITKGQSEALMRVLLEEEDRRGV